MKPATKIVIFLIIAFIIVIIIAAVRSNTAVAPVTASPSPTESATPAREMTYTMSDVVKHKSATDCWTTVSESVYNLTPFINQHPGGVENITKVCGIDGTALFTAQHGSSDAAKKALASLRIGLLTQ